MKQNNLSPAPGANRKRKLVGRGDGSGHGSFSGRGCKGQKARAGYITKPGFEGGQLPLTKKLPRKRGFFNPFRTEYSIINLGELNRFEPGSEVTPEKLLAAGLIKSIARPVKILAEGALAGTFTIRAHKFSSAAKTKIEAAGGKAEEIADAGKTD